MLTYSISPGSTERWRICFLQRSRHSNVCVASRISSVYYCPTAERSSAILYPSCSHDLRVPSLSIQYQSLKASGPAPRLEGRQPPCAIRCWAAAVAAQINDGFVASSWPRHSLKLIIRSPLPRVQLLGLGPGTGAWPSTPTSDCQSPFRDGA